MMRDTLEIILQKNGPMLSGELAEEYKKVMNTTDANARKVISRAKSPIQKNTLIPFQNKQSFVYLENQYRSYQYWRNLADSINKESKIVQVILNALLSQGGLFSKESLAAYSFSPIDNLKGHKRVDIILEKVMKAGVISEYNENYIQISDGYLHDTEGNKVIDIKDCKAFEIAKKIVLNDFNDFLRKMNIISYNTGKIWTIFAHMQWGFASPSYVHGIAKWNNRKNEINPGFIVADIILQRDAGVSDVLFFVEKVKIIRMFKNISNFIPTLLVYSLMPEALEMLKKHNIVIAFIDRLFGKDYVELLSELMRIIKNATAIMINNPERIDKVFTSLENRGGNYNNIVGDFFELVVAELFNELGVSYLEVNKQVKGIDTISKRPREIDVMVCKDGVMIVIECKARLSMISKSEVEEWLTIKVPDIHKFLSSIYPNRKFEYHFWSIGGFTKEASEHLSERKERAKKYKVNYFDKDAMLQFAKEKNASKFIKRIKQHFS